MACQADRLPFSPFVLFTVTTVTIAILVKPNMPVRSGMLEWWENPGEPSTHSPQEGESQPLRSSGSLALLPSRWGSLFAPVGPCRILLNLAMDDRPWGNSLERRDAARSTSL